MLQYVLKILNMIFYFCGRVSVVLPVETPPGKVDILQNPSLNAGGEHGFQHVLDIST